MRSKVRITALVLIACMILTALMACKGKQSTTGTTTAATTAGTTAATTATAPEEYGPRPYDERVTLSIPVYDFGNTGQTDLTNNYWTGWINEQVQELYNLEIEFISIPRYVGDLDKFNMLIAAGNEPDVICHFELPSAMTFYTMGALQAIPEELVDEYGPVYKEKVGEKVLGFGVIDGVRYYLPAARPTNTLSTGGTFPIRMDWLEKVDMEKPTTLEETNAVLEAWRDAKPAGANTIPFGMRMPDFVNITNEGGNWFFGTLTEEEYVLYSDINIPCFTFRAGKEWMKWCNYLYNNNLISKEFALDKDWNVVRSHWANGYSGISRSVGANASQGLFAALMENVPDAKVDYLEGNALSPGGTEYRRYSAVPFGLLSGISRNCENPEAFIMYINWMCDADVLFYLQYGIEDKTFKYDDAGNALFIAGYAGEDRLLDGNNASYWYYATLSTEYNSVDSQFAALKSAITPGFEYLVDQSRAWGELTSPVDGKGGINYYNIVFKETLEAYNKYAATLKDKFLEYLVQLITAKETDFDSLYETLCQDYLNMGYQEVLDERKALWDGMSAEDKAVWWPQESLTKSWSELLQK